MPEYPIPPWLRPPPDPGEQFVQSYHVGAQIAQAQASHAQQAAHEQMRMEFERQQKERDFQMEQQRIEIGKQQKAIEFGFEKDRIDTARARADLATRQAAQKYAAQQDYETLYQKYGGTPEAARKAGMEIGPRLFTGQGLAALTRPDKPPTPTPVWHPADKATGAPGFFEHGGRVTIPPGMRTGTPPVWHPADPKTGAPGYFEEASGVAKIPAAVRPTGEIGPKEQLSYWKEREKELAKDPQVGMDTKGLDPEFKAAVDAKNAEWKEVKDNLKRLLPKGGAAAPPPPGSYKTSAEVKAALKSGKIKTVKEAAEILRRDFPDEFE